MSDGFSARIEEETELLRWEDAESCNRRLSRAARSLLEATLRETVLLRDPLINANDDIWTLLEYWLRDANPAECPLFPSRDILRQDEEHAIAIKPVSYSKGAYPALTIKERRIAKSARPKYWWKCVICSKIFSSRYYMDLHLQTHHNPDKSLGGISVRGGPMLICPAKEWCQLLGEANCHEQALRSEPFYDRGSSGLDSDGQLVQHRYAKQARSIPCDIESLQSNCRSTLAVCRVTDTSICETLTCPAHTMYFWNGFSSTFIPGDWHSVWIHETKHHKAGTIAGISLCVLLCIWVYYMWMVEPYVQERCKSDLKFGRGETLKAQRPITTVTQPRGYRVRKFD